MTRLILISVLLISIVFPHAVSGKLSGNLQKDSILLTGRVLDASTREPIPFFPLRIFNAHDTARLLQAVLSDKSGVFRLRISRSDQVLLFNPVFIGYENDTISLKNVVQKRNRIEIDMMLRRSAISLKGVTITDDGFGGRSLPFKKEYKIRPLQTHEKPILQSFLKELPELTYEGNEFKADGTKDVTFYLNGFKSNRELILNLPLNIIDKVEIISNPALVRSMNQNEVILNVITKKTAGTIGSSNSLSGSFINPMAGAMIEPFLLQKDLLIAISANIYTTKSRSDYSSKWEAPANGLDSISETGKRRNTNTPIFITYFMQKNISKKMQTSLSFSYTKMNMDLRHNLNSSTYIRNKPVNAFSEEVLTKRNSRELYLGGELSYQDEKTGVFLNLSWLNNKTRNDISDHIDRSVLSSSLASLSDSRNTDYAGQISMEQKWSQKISQRIGFGYSLRNINSALLNSTETGSIQTEGRYKETTLSIFSNLGINLKVATISLGARAEFSNNFSERKLFSKRFLFSPQLYVYKQTSKAGTFNLSASQTISVPNQLQVANGFTPVNKYNVTYGSTMLNREITRKIDITHNITLSKKYKLYLNSNAFYTSIKDLIASNGYRYDDTLNSFYRFQDNIGAFRSTGIYLGFTKYLSKIGYIKAGGTYSYNAYDLKDSITLRRSIFNFRASITANISKSFTLSISSGYRNLTVSPYTIINLKPSIDITVSGKLIKDKLYLELYWTDLFNINGRQHTKYNSFYVSRNIHSNNYSQNVSFSLTYIMGKTTDKQKSSNRIVEKQEVKAEQVN